MSPLHDVLISDLSHLQVPVALSADEEDAAAAGAVGRPLLAFPAPAEEALLGHQHAGRLHPADELVRGEEHGVLLQEVAVQAGNLF